MNYLRVIISYILFGLGGFFGVVTVLGLLRFPDLYTRMHAGAVALTISAVLISVGASIYVWEFYLSLKILLIGFFFLISNPMATHAIARASYRKKIAKPDKYKKDEYSLYLGNDD
ncbi:monovalent cation/H(+) antiporter subunit G [Halothermothrix orenii]|uniref:Monovalent cation/proton antiporter, MnhG/PhaG subunit n=1 Tax=Halothermothrix orenii (strain H 168 / OCM 544 / DSM 9562) TaxID=373903 RepID=B8CXE1_HALOH|nr:monovalent cation/H(+) antiporter subunit G [Halothermothrix orenii]ACL69960.1 monovalent cation/proton antiporter, MnhG/PhaG subunit [Halothermothrix orenii H 168]